MEKMKFLGSYIKGGFQSPPKKHCTQKHISPADFKDLIFTWTEQNNKEIDSPVLAGQKAYKNWSKLPLKERVKKLSPLKTVIKKNIKSWAEIISRETGKALWESEGEVKALISKLDFVLNEGLNRIQDQVIPQAGGENSL